MAVVDLHILTHAGTNPDWLDQALASCKGQPVNVHVIPNGSHIDQGRARGFATGSADFVGILDSDDWLLPGAVESCLEALANRPDAVGAFTDEVRMRDGVQVGVGESTGTGPWCPTRQLTRISYARHLMVMRRAIVMPLLPVMSQHARLSEYVLRGLAVQQGPWIHVERDGYVHREHDGNVSKVTPTTDGQVRAAVLRVKPFLFPTRPVPTPEPRPPAPVPRGQLTPVQKALLKRQCLTCG